MSSYSISDVRERAERWLEPGFDDQTRSAVKLMLEGDENLLTDAFYNDLEFGTGGMRGVMGVGTNRMNRYTVGMAAQGQANYIRKVFGDGEHSVAIAYDCRLNSPLFAKTAASIFSANGFIVYLFDDIRPTPMLSFAIRDLGCKGGVVITASHNPPEYNGYKAYWDDGGQVVPPHDNGIIKEVRSIKSVSDISFPENSSGPVGQIVSLGSETDRRYIETVASLSLTPHITEKHTSMGIVFTPIHGTTAMIGPAVLRRFGFSNITGVPEQDIPDGNFPTVKSPNPEEPEALSMAIRKAEESEAVIVMATDPDGDRLGVAVRESDNSFTLLNGNETAALLTWHIVSQMSSNGLLKGNEFIIKTIVTSELIAGIANDYGVKCFDVLTGFKYFAWLIRKLEGKMKYIGGGEESFGYLPGDYIRDKDGPASCALMAEIAAIAESQGKSVTGLLDDIWLRHGLWRERLVNMVLKGIDGAATIGKMMDDYRNNSPSEIAGSPVIQIKDYLTLVTSDIVSGTKSSIDSMPSNVLQFQLADGSLISVRPSGTEPKIKFYISVNGRPGSSQELKTMKNELERRIDTIIEDMKI